MTTTEAQAPADPIDDTTSWQDARDEYEATLSEADRIAYEAGLREGAAQSLCSQLVYDARAAADLTQTELAERAGTRQGVISHIEHGQVPTVQMLIRLADALGKDVEINFVDKDE